MRYNEVQVEAVIRHTKNKLATKEYNKYLVAITLMSMVHSGRLSRQQMAEILRQVLGTAGAIVTVLAASRIGIDSRDLSEIADEAHAWTMDTRSRPLGLL